MQKIIVLFTLVLSANAFSQQAEKDIISKRIDAWHQAAAQADFDAYFGLMTDDAVFIGTDATENWNLKEFKAFSKPYFDRGKAWDFNAIERNIYVGDNGSIAWFDELLDTHMKICRGSGVLKKTNGIWKIAHYVLSITIPNDDIDAVKTLKAKFDDELVKKLKQ